MASRKACGRERAANGTAMLPADHWIADRSTLEVRPHTLSAGHYNDLRLGLLRLGEPLRLRLPWIKGLGAIIDHHAWVAIDRMFNDQPLFALTGFQRRHDALHEPVACEVRILHFRADLILEHAIDGMREAMAEALDAAGATQSRDAPGDIGIRP